MSGRTRRRVRFSAPGSAEIISEELPEPGQGEVLVRTLLSGVSPGSERLVYKGRVPTDMQADATIDALTDEDFSYPVSYGYACVGEVEEAGRGVEDKWKGTKVFAFQPHVSRFVASVDTLVALPDSVETADAVMLPSVETAVNLVMDGRPVIGENVFIFGQGVIGLLTARLLSNFPLNALVTIDPVSSRRAASEKMGATLAVEDSSEIILANSERREEGFVCPQEEGAPEKADLTYELSGRPSTLNEAVEHTGFDGRIIVGSWYGTKTAPVDFGEHFHRSRIRIRSSQVSTISPEYQGRWTKTRRLAYVVSLLSRIHPGRLVSDRFRLKEAPGVYEKLASGEHMLQPVFEYE